MRDSLGCTLEQYVLRTIPMSKTPNNRILIVDDDQSIRTTVAMLLRAKGYEISTAEDGFDAAEFAVVFQEFFAVGAV